MISGTLTNIYKKIEEAGVSGLRKTQLVKEFGKDAPKQLEELISQGMVYTAKKRNSIIYWTKDNYANNNKKSKATKSKVSNDKREISDDKVAMLAAEMEKKFNEVHSMLNNKLDNNLLEELNSKLEGLKKDLDERLTNKITEINNRIATLSKEHDTDKEMMRDSMNKQLSTINKKIDELTKVIESKADSNKIVEVEKNLSKGLKKMDAMDKNMSKVSKNANERLDRLLRQISGKADDIKVFEMERKLESLLQVEAKLSSLENTMKTFDNRLNEVRDEMDKSTAIIRAELQTISNGNGTHSYDTLSLEQFKMEFDRTIAERSTSIGWIELAEIRSRICEKYGISKNTFYSLVSQLLDTYDEIYELSSGGSEGVMVRGLVHGFIRRI